MTYSYQDPIVFNSKIPGKNLAIMAGVHGNEICGIRAFEQLIPTLQIERGMVTFIYGNPRAIVSGKRFTDANLNRLFLDDSELSTQEKNSYEYARSRELMPILKNADALLDIHSSYTPGSEPFVICEPQSFDIAKEMPVSTVSSNWDRIEPGGADYFVNKFGGKGLCIECGYHNDSLAVDRATKAIYAFLASMGALTTMKNNVIEIQRHIKVESLYKTKINFEPTRHFSDFETVKKGELIGRDGLEEIRSNKDCNVIFVRNRNSAAEDAFLIGSEI